jgi:plastocyanin
MSLLKRLSPLAILGVMLLNVACHTDPVAVQIVDFRFKPRVASQLVGGEVDWTNDGAVAHTTTNVQGHWDSGSIAPGAGYTKEVNFAGRFGYRCTIHPRMGGVIGVGPFWVTTVDPTTDDDITVYWAFDDSGPTSIPAGYDADIQVLKPRRDRYVPWLLNQTGTQTQGIYNPNRAGVYRFRARLQNTTTGATGGWSPSAAVKIARA